MSAAYANTMMTFAPTVSVVPLSNNLYQFPYAIRDNWSHYQNNSYPAAVGIPIDTIFNLPVAIGVKIQPFPIVSRQTHNGMWTHEAIVN